MKFLKLQQTQVFQAQTDPSVMTLHSSTCLTMVLWSWDLMRCLDKHRSSASCYSSQQLQDENTDKVNHACRYGRSTCHKQMVQLHTCVPVQLRTKQVQNKTTARRKDNKRRTVCGNDVLGINHDTDCTTQSFHISIQHYSPLLSESSPMTQAGLWVFRLISRTWLSRSESRLHPAPITRDGGRPLCLQATWVMMSTGSGH